MTFDKSEVIFLLISGTFLPADDSLSNFSPFFVLFELKKLPTFDKSEVLFVSVLDLEF